MIEKYITRSFGRQTKPLDRFEDQVGWQDPMEKLGFHGDRSRVLPTDLDFPRRARARAHTQAGTSLGNILRG